MRTVSDRDCRHIISPSQLSSSVIAISGLASNDKWKGKTGQALLRALAPTIRVLSRSQSRLAELSAESSALSQLNFGIDGFEFTAGIVDSHLPVDAALSGVDIV